jgi:CRISPR-associated protein Csb3
MEIRIKVGRMNPCEYFAGMGVLELLSQQDSSLRSHFEGSGNVVEFVIETTATMPDLRTLDVTALAHSDQYTAPVTVGGMRLDWWLDAFKESGNPLLKLWAGTTSPLMMLTNYQSLMQGEMSLNLSVKTKTKSTFNLDTRASRDPLAAGYSQKDAGEASVVYPYAEFLCAVGLQNFRPAQTKKSLTYFTWARPLRTSIAHAACRMEVAGLQSAGFEVKFRKVSQGMREVKSVVSLQAAMAACGQN